VHKASVLRAISLKNSPGFIGAYLGMWIAAKMGLPEFFTVNIQGKPFPIIWAIIGSAIFTLIMALIRRAFIGGNRV